MSGVSIDPGPELEGMIEVARAASARAAELYREHVAGGIRVGEKGPGDYVTAADEELDASIGAALRERFPDAAVVAEESAPGGATLREHLGRERVFFVDPIDGTREFVERTGEFAVMIGLAVEGRAKCGVVALPATGRLLAGRAGARAFSEDASGRRAFIEVSTQGKFPDCRPLVSRSRRPRLWAPLAKRLGMPTPTPCGSVGVKVARVALGEADVYVHGGGGMKLWDSCAPEAILTAAAGRLTDLDGGLVDYRDPDLRLRRGLVATNGRLHPGVLSAVGWAEREAARLDP